MLDLRVDLADGHDDCGPGCASFLARWRRFWAEHAAADAPPVAIMVCESYVDGLGQKSRAMVRQARRGYEFREFAISEHAADVKAVNHSKTQTSQGPLNGWLAGSVLPLPDAFDGLCKIHSDRWFGGFDDTQTLRGYVRLVRMNTLAVIHSIFRHQEHSTGVLNGLLAHIAEHGGADHISYHTMDAEPHSGRPAFKRRTGFQDARLSLR